MTTVVELALAQPTVVELVGVEAAGPRGPQGPEGPRGPEPYGDLDGGHADSLYGGTSVIDGGNA